MKFNRLVPTIFYTDIKVGLNLFVDCFGFRIYYDELDSSQQPFCVLERDGLKVHLVQNREFAEKDRPEIRLETDHIDDVYAEIRETFPGLLHPNLSGVVAQPWKIKEFALLDESGVCVIIQEFMK